MYINVNYLISSLEMDIKGFTSELDKRDIFSLWIY